MVRFEIEHKVEKDTMIQIASAGCSKRDFTVALAAHANGDKMPAFCILKEHSGQILFKVWARP